MRNLKRDFIQLAIKANALKFGKFTLKSGRISPFFFNAGSFYQGATLQYLGDFYAQTLINNNAKFDQLFGAAYKGIPIATATAIALSSYNINTSVTFNRKETKSHGEGGSLIGAPLKGDIILIDDVITAGTTFRESQNLIQSHGGKLTGIIIALDRNERGLDQKSALQEIKAQGIPVYSIITIFDILDYLKAENLINEAENIIAYQKKYGC